MYDFATIKTKWPDIFSRQEAEKLTGGVVKARTLANLDSLGLGPSGSFKIGRKKCYDRDKFVEWLQARAQGY
jgi:hypothetical protein